MIGSGALVAALFLVLLPEVQTLPWEYLPGELFNAPAALVYESRPGPEDPEEVAADGVAETQSPPAHPAPVVESRQVTDPATTLSGPSVGPSVGSPVVRVPVKRTAPVRPPGLYLDGLLWRHGGGVRAAWINGRLWEGRLPAPRVAPLARQMRRQLRGRDARGSSPSPILRLPGWERALRVGQGWPGGPRSGAPVWDPMSLGIRGPADRGGRP